MKNLLKFCIHSMVVGLAAFCGLHYSFAAPGDLYVGNRGQEIDRFTPTGEQSVFASGLREAIALAFDRDGDLFVGDSGENPNGPPVDSIIYVYGPDGTRRTFANLGLVDLWAMAFDGSGNLFVSTFNEILKFSPDGTQTTFASDVEIVWSLVFDQMGNLYAGLSPGGDILKFTPEGKRSTFFTTAPSDGVTGLAFDNEGNLFATRGELLLKITPDGSSTTFATGDFSNNSLSFDASGNLFAGEFGTDSDDPAIVKFSPEGIKTTFAAGFLSPWGVACEPVTEKLRNISARGLVGTGDDVLIGGFIVGGNALANNAIVVRAIGPSLAQGGVANPLADPTLELHDSSGAIVASNDDWQDTQEEQIAATGLAPSDPSESAIYATLPAGNYTGVVRGAGATTGTALVEIYSVSQ